VEQHVDDVLSSLAGIVRDLRAVPIPDAVAREAKRRVLDTIGIAIGGFEELPTQSVRRYALADAVREGSRGATVLGTGHTTVPEIAALANGAAMHSQDFMDTYLSPSGEACHPADIIPGVLALAEHLDSPPEDVIRAIVIAYEVACRLCDAAQIRSRGWDHVTYMGIAASCACASLLGLDEAAALSAISLATIPSIALRQTRNGEISMWKACAPATAVQHGVRSARLAAAGLRGPTEPFVGTNGFERRVSGPLDRGALRRTDEGEFLIASTHIKNFPSQYHTQAGIEAALAIRARLRTPVQEDPIASLRVTTSRVCWDLTADTPNKWNPETRETADHSMPYLVVTAMRDGTITREDFEERRFRDPERLADAARVRVETNTTMDAEYPEKLTVSIDVTQASGETYSHRVDHPLGHARRPMTDAQVEAKFRGLASARLGETQADQVIGRVWDLDNIPDMRALLGPISVKQPDSPFANLQGSGKS
jgi:2-methylcitrate dehydratase